HWSQRASVGPAQWSLNLVLDAGEGPIGCQELSATDFAASRAVETGSWIGQRWQGQGLGVEMRAAILHLAFAGLGAEVARSSAFEHNVASQRISERLGYARAGEATAAPRGEPMRELLYRLDRDAWEQVRREDIRIEGLEPCRALLGAVRA